MGRLKFIALFAAMTAATAVHATSVGPFMIFFDPGRATITRGAAPILDNSVPQIRTWPGAVFVIEGHGDTVGAARANIRLSCRRARAVRAYLVAKGIPAEQLISVGYGENRPLLPSADGVAEPQNRYVEIKFMVLHQVAEATVGATRC